MKHLNEIFVYKRHRFCYAVQRERAVSQSLHDQLQQKEQQLLDVCQGQKALEEEIANLSSGKEEVKSENSQLLQVVICSVHGACAIAYQRLCKYEVICFYRLRENDKK